MRNIHLILLTMAAVVLFSMPARAGELHDAVDSGDLNKVRQLLEQGANVNAMGEKWYSARLCCLARQY